MIKKISVLLAAFLVMFLSIGLNISKMKCAIDGDFYFGTEVPSCSIETQVVCQDQEEKTSCCAKEIVKSCCPETNDASCASETENLQFNFETLISHEYEFTFIELPLRLSMLSGYISQTAKLSDNYYLSGVPPPKMKQPLFVETQTFLL